MARLVLRSLLIWLLVAFLLWLDQALPHASTPHAGAFIGWILSGIATIFGFVASHAVTFAVMVAHVAAQLAIAVGHAMVLVGGVFMRVYGLLGNFWRSILRPTLAYIARGFDRLVGWLNRVLRPVIEIVERIRAHVQRIYDAYVRPILDAIDVTRRVFQILASLHVPFARAIDAKLAELEDRLLAPIRFVMQKLNEALNWINRIVTLDGYLQRVTLIRSLMRYSVDGLKIWWTSVHRPLVGERRAAYERPLETRTIDEAATDLVAYVRRGDGPDRARIDEHAADLRLRLLRDPRFT